jgi:ABC-type glycerol-3-phosphate transport system permease component
LVTVLTLSFVLLWTFAPILWTFSLSLKGLNEIFGMPVRLIPHAPSLDNYSQLFRCMPELLVYSKNSIITTMGAVATTVFCATLMGYAFARLEFRGRDMIFSLMIAAIFIPQVGGLMAQYEIMHALDLRNSRFGLALLFASQLSVPIFIIRQHFLGVPSDIEDAAKIDGAGAWRLFLQIALPFATSGILIVATLTFVNVWGEYMTTLTMIDDHELYTLGVGLTMFNGCGAEVMQSAGNISREGIIAASYLVASAPAVLLYIAMQDLFAQALAGKAIEL